MKLNQRSIKFHTIVKGLLLGTERQKSTSYLILVEKKPNFHITIVDGASYINQPQNKVVGVELGTHRYHSRSDAILIMKRYLRSKG